MNINLNRFIAFILGINVGGHHKVPMKELSFLLNQMGFSSIITILNSGNVIFESQEKNLKTLENQKEWKYWKSYLEKI
ncbi:DUF1697 domain-containing protein [Belliella sp. DSM 107340]|uniref:DUF1697 domain-containing protein n=1 Tax=Belliella calami TaxID=2923436 RepID=A0ABS9US83_9BACT|nr:DUF1697 domain-containing protein [Belliella calami]